MRVCLRACVHSYLGSVAAQIRYSNSTTSSHPGLWQYPAEYYVINERAPDGTTVDIVMFDSIILLGVGEKLADGSISPPTGPADASAAETQWQWIEQQLATSQADYLFTAAHYPVWSVRNCVQFHSILSVGVLLTSHCLAVGY